MEERLYESWKDRLEHSVEKPIKKVSGGYPGMIPGNVFKVIPDEITGDSTQGWFN